MDTEWWRTYRDEVNAKFQGERWTCNTVFGVRRLRVDASRNSGAGAIVLAASQGARRIILLGYDCKTQPGLRLAVVPQQDDAPGALAGRQHDGPGTAVARGIHPQAAHAEHRVARPALALKLGVDLIAVGPPPLRVHRIQGISPGRDAEAGIGDNYAALGLGLAPFFGLLAVPRREAWAAGDAEDFPPAAWAGR